MSRVGARLFAQFAYPPNALGYCGPPDPDALLGYLTAGPGRTRDDDRGAVSLARRFDGAWPYLQLIAASNHVSDPLDIRVVEAYWIGNSLLDRVSPALLWASLTDRFGTRLHRGTDSLGAAVFAGARPHHGFHVFGVYPWAGLLRSGIVDPSLHVVDRCRIREGRVLSVDGATAVVSSRRIVWDRQRLRAGQPRVETVRTVVAGLAPGDHVAMHWDWICTVLSPGQARRLRQWNRRDLAAIEAGTLASVRSPGLSAAMEA